MKPLDTARGETERELQLAAAPPKEWKIEKRWCGHSNCFSQLRTVLGLGKWSVSGSTGHYVVTGPDGWDIERKEPFRTESDAKTWVEVEAK